MVHEVSPTAAAKQRWEWEHELELRIHQVRGGGEAPHEVLMNSSIVDKARDTVIPPQFDFANNQQPVGGTNNLLVAVAGAGASLTSHVTSQFLHFFFWLGG